MTTSPLTSQSPIHRHFQRPLVIFLALVAAGGAALAVDVPLAHWILAGHTLGALGKLCTLAEGFGHGLGVMLIALTLFTLDPPRRWALPRVLLASLGAGLMANTFKLLVARSRPHDFDFSGGALDTISGWLPLLGGGSGQQSFPSSHTATAVGLAIALSWLYPRGRWLFAFLAALVAGQRMLSGAHFLSDVIVGGAVGYLVASYCVGDSALSAWIGRIERPFMPQDEAGIDPAPDAESTAAASKRPKRGTRAA